VGQVLAVGRSVAALIADSNKLSTLRGIDKYPSLIQVRYHAWGNAHTELVVFVVYAAIQRDCRACRALVTFHKALATITNQVADSKGVDVVLVHTHPT